MITLNATSLRLALNRMDPNKLPDMLRSVAFGDILRAGKTSLRGVKLDGAAASNPYVLAAAQSITLPDDAKAGNIVRAYARSGTGTVGVLTVDAGGDAFSGVEPVAGHCAVAPSGDLIFQHADAWTSVDVIYEPEKFVMVEVTLSSTTPTSSLFTLPTSLGLALFIAEAEALTAAAGKTGKKIIDVCGTATPATGHATLTADKKTANFNVATDVVTSARVKFAVIPSVDLNALLEAASNF